MPSLLSRFTKSRDELPSQPTDGSSTSSSSSPRARSLDLSWSRADDAPPQHGASTNPTLLVHDLEDDSIGPHPPPSPIESLHRITSISSRTSSRGRSPSPSRPPSTSTSASSLHPDSASPASTGTGAARAITKKASARLSKILPDKLLPASLVQAKQQQQAEFYTDDSPTPHAEPSVSPLGAEPTPTSSASTTTSGSSITPTQTATTVARSRRSSMASSGSSTTSFERPYTHTHEAAPPPIPLAPAISAPPNFRSPSPPPSSSPYPQTNATMSATSLTRSSSRQSNNSVAPGSSSKDKDKAWRRGSTSSRTSKRPSAGASSIASALATSGLTLTAGMAPSTSPTNSTRYPASTVSSGSSSAHNRARSTASLPLKPGDGAYYSHSDSDSSDGEELSPDAFSIEDEDIPSITGFAVASSKRNADFHDLFPEVESDDYLIEDYGCALQREILIQGRLYISENHISFHANIFGWITNVVIPFREIASLEKRMTAFVIPNAILVTTISDQKHTFASFLSRDTTYDVLSNIWRLKRPGIGSAGGSLREGSILEEEDEGASDTSGGGGGGMTGTSDMSEAHVASALVDSPTQLLTPTPTTGRTLGTASTSVSIGSAMSQASPSTSTAPTSPAHHNHHHSHSPVKRTHAKPHRATQCACSKRKEHFAEVAREYVLPGTPESIYNLMFASGFVKEFMSNEQGLKDLQISDWKPEATGSNLLSRNMSYIKPLTASVGPKQTKCELRDETVHVDFDDYVTTLTTTRTPDVPSGSVFSVKTRTCIMWAGPASTKVIVTTAVEWTGRSFIKSIIDRSAIEGQKTYHKDLEKAMRQYISEHRGEFIPEGLEEPPTAPEPTVAAPTAEPVAAPALTEAERRRRSRAKLDGMRGLQWILDTVTGAGNVGRQSFWGAIDLIGDVIEDWNWTTVLALVVFFLIVSNVWTLLSLRQAQSRAELTRRRAGEYDKIGGGGGRREEAWDDGRVASVATEAVKAFLEEMVGRHKSPLGSPALPSGDTPREEMEALARALEEIERRVGALKELLPETE